MRDQIYANPRSEITPFAFDAEVAAVFDDMIHRSVPGYAWVLQGIEQFARRFARPAGRCYDLGCALGAATLALQRGCAGVACRVVAVDNAWPMVQRARGLVPQYRDLVSIDWLCADVRDVSIRAAGFVVLNYTLQFLPVEQRSELLARVWAGLQPGGALLLSEKICFDAPQLQSLCADMHVNFKRTQGYSELEISQKRAALEQVLTPETLAVHQARLSQAGFVEVGVWWQCFNFVSLLAIK